MSLISLVIVLLIIGVLLGIVNRYGPSLMLDGTILRIINAVVIVAVILWLLAVFFPGLADIRVGSVR